MDAFDAIRDLARNRHREARDAAGGDVSAIGLLDGATAITGIEREAVAPDDPLLCGADAILDTDTSAIFYKNAVTPSD